LLFYLPLLENMHAVQSALTQVVEVLAADMIDPNRAQLDLSALCMAADNFKNPAAWCNSANMNSHFASRPRHLRRRGGGGYSSLCLSLRARPKSWRKPRCHLPSV
jgi:hypothetical protein